MTHNGSSHVDLFTLNPNKIREFYRGKITNTTQRTSLFNQAI